MNKYPKYPKYPSIENHYRKKYIDKIKKYHNEQWIVQEKIHGSNFVIIYDKDSETVMYGKRNSLLGESKLFYDYEQLTPQLTECMSNLTEYYINKNIIVYGELCGGKYDKIKNKSVQQEVDYCDKIIFVAFDIKINNLFIPFSESEKILNEAGFITVPKIGIYPSLKDAMEINQVFTSLLPDKLGMKKHSGNNLCEGIVIKPLCKIPYLIAIKKKNPAFAETKNKSSKSLNKSNPYDKYITVARLSNIKSKFEEDASIQTIAKEMIKDVVEEYCKDNETSMRELKSLRKAISIPIFKIVKSHYQTVN